jgi:hypothetical protein
MASRRLLPFLFLAAACEGEPENIQTKAENISRQLEGRAAEISAEADNEVAAVTAPFDEQADTLLNQIEANAGQGNLQAETGVEER